MKIYQVIASGALIAATQTVFANNDHAELRQELNNYFLQDKIYRISEDDLTIREDLGEYWLKNSKQHEVDVIQDGVKQLGSLMLETYVITESPILNTNLSEEVTSGRQEYRVLRDAHPKGHQCVTAAFDVEANDFFPEGSFLGENAHHEAVIRYSTATASPTPDSSKGALGGAIKVQVGDQEHDFVMITADKLPTDNAEDFINLVKVARIANCSSIVAGDSESDSFFGALFRFEQQVLEVGRCISDAGLSLFDVPAVVVSLGRLVSATNRSEVTSVFDKPFFGISPYAFDDTVFKFEMAQTACSEVNTEDMSLTAEEALLDNGIEQNIKRVLSAGTACYDLSVVARPDGLSDKQAIESLSKTWDEMSASELERTKVATVVVSQIDTASEISALACDEMQFSPDHTVDRFRALGSVNRARAIVYEALSEFRLEANEYLRQ